ncbi:MAG: hypothetical protein WBA25_17230, partial [Jannaschia sp.]
MGRALDRRQALRAAVEVGRGVEGIGHCLFHGDEGPSFGRIPVQQIVQMVGVDPAHVQQQDVLHILSYRPAILGFVSRSRVSCVRTDAT